jgi:ATP-binding cassette subfamily B (MDR/TAP) protein 1
LQTKCAGRQAKAEPVANTVSAPTLLERSFHDIIVLQAYSLQEDVSQKYSDALAPDEELKKKQGMYSGAAYGFSQFSVFATFALIFWAGIQLMADGKVGFVDFFVALLAVMFSAFAAGQSGADFGARQEGIEAGARIFELVDEPLGEDDPFSSVGTLPSTLKGEVKFSACHFAYPTRPMAPIYYPNDGRDGFTLDIPSKESVAFTGRSGKFVKYHCDRFSRSTSTLLNSFESYSNIIRLWKVDCTPASLTILPCIFRICRSR